MRLRSFTSCGQAMNKATKEEKKNESFHNSWNTRREFKQEPLKAEKLMEKA